MIKIIDGKKLKVSQILELLKRPGYHDFKEESQLVQEILANIREQGAPALLDYLKKYDGQDFKDCSEILVSKKEIEKAYQDTPQDLIEIIKRAAQRIRSYHEKQKQKSWLSFEEEIILGQKVTPLSRVGIYVPGGRAAYPSSVLMNAIPAQIAGVKDICMTTPAGPDGLVNPFTLVAADLIGLETIYKMGGAQSIGALAFGVDSIAPVDKITGPGNIYVTLAKKEVYGYVDIDMIAGPSEIVVLADSSAKVSFIAADLLSQAEHDPLSTSILITNDYDLAYSSQEEINKQAKLLPKYNIIKESLSNYGAIILVSNLEEGIKLANALAPEHLELALADPFASLGKIRHAGSIFLGHYTPEALGDYLAGPNHILPTSGSARFFSPLGVDDFIKKSSFLSFSQKALENYYQDVAKFAQYEGLKAHGRSVEVRFEDNA